MNQKEIQEKLRVEEDVDYITQFNYNNKTYIKALKFENEEIQYVYYELIANTLNIVKDEDIIDYFNKKYQSTNIIY